MVKGRARPGHRKATGSLAPPSRWWWGVRTSAWREDPAAEAFQNLSLNLPLKPGTHTSLPRCPLSLPRHCDPKSRTSPTPHILRGQKASCLPSLHSKQEEDGFLVTQAQLEYFLLPAAFPDLRAHSAHSLKCQLPTQPTRPTPKLPGGHSLAHCLSPGPRTLPRPEKTLKKYLLTEGSESRLAAAHVNPAKPFLVGGPRSRWMAGGDTVSTAINLHSAVCVPPPPGSPPPCAPALALPSQFPLPPRTGLRPPPESGSLSARRGRAQACLGERTGSLRPAKLRVGVRVWVSGPPGAAGGSVRSPARPLRPAGYPVYRPGN